MKFCPTCETRYDEEILRFCTKDGTPLIDEDQPKFTEMPSQTSVEDDDLGEETMVSYKPRKEILDPEPQPEIDRSEAPRIVISTSEQKKEQNVRSRNIPPYQPIPPKPNTTKVVLLTVLGTLAVLAMVLGLFVFMRDDEPANMNVNINTSQPNLNLNNNLNLGSFNYNVPTNANFNVNTNFNINLNSNFNANIKTPTPSPKPSPSANVNTNANITNSITNNAPPPTPRPSTPTPSATPTPAPTRSNPANVPTGRPANNSEERDN